MLDKQKVEVKNSKTLIGLGKSKRLADMRQSVEQHAAKKSAGRNHEGNKGQLTQQAQARDLVRLKIAEIKSSYPQGMQGKLFALRYGSEENINQMGLQQLFKLLDIRQNIAREICKIKLKEQ